MTWLALEKELSVESSIHISFRQLHHHFCLRLTYIEGETDPLTILARKRTEIADDALQVSQLEGVRLDSSAYLNSLHLYY